MDLLASAGFSDVSLVEDSFVLDFDEWFDRGTPGDTKPAVRERLLSGPFIRELVPASCLEDGSIRIDGVRALVRGVKDPGFQADRRGGNAGRSYSP